MLCAVSVPAPSQLPLSARCLHRRYAEYRRSREEMRELLAAKANMDRLLKMDEEQKKEQEKDHDQR